MHKIIDKISTPTYLTQSLVDEVRGLRNSKNSFYKKEVATRLALMFKGPLYSAYDAGHGLVDVGSLLLKAGSQKVLSPKSAALKNESHQDGVSFQDIKKKSYEAMAYLVNILASFVLGAVPEMQIAFLEKINLIKAPVSVVEKAPLISRRMKIGVLAVAAIVSGVALAYYYQKNWTYGHRLANACNTKFNQENFYKFQFEEPIRYNRPFPSSFQRIDVDAFNEKITTETAPDVLSLAAGASRDAIKSRVIQLNTQFNVTDTPSWLQDTAKRTQLYIQDAEESLLQPKTYWIKSAFNGWKNPAVDMDICTDDAVLKDELVQLPTFRKPISIFNQASVLLGLPANATAAEVEARYHGLEQRYGKNYCPDWLKERCIKIMSIFTEAKESLIGTLSISKKIEQIQKGLGEADTEKSVIAKTLDSISRIFSIREPMGSALVSYGA